MASEQRKHPRFRHTDTVELLSGSETFSGTSVNLSRSGMQVVVKMAATYDSIQSIAFQIPGSFEKVLLPCRLIRSFERKEARDQALGIEFLSEDDAQLFLIEKFIEDSQLNRNEERQLPRTCCHIEDVMVVSQELQVLSIENLSTEGLLLNYKGSLEQGETLELSVGIPGDERRLSLSGIVMYVMDNVFRGSLTAGLRLSIMKEVEERRLRNLIITCAAGSAIRDMHEHLSTRGTGPEYQINDPNLIDSVFQSLNMECVRLSTLMDGSFIILEHEIEQLDQNLRQFAIRPNPDIVKKVKLGESAYFAFYWNKGSHYFKTKVASVGGDRLTFPIPPTVFRSNKRSYQRKPLRESAVSLRIDGGHSEQKSIAGTLLDISRRGFLCELCISTEMQSLFQKGKSVRYKVDDRLGLGSEGQIRHLKVLPSAGGVVIQVGIEAGIGRSSVLYKRIRADKWEEEKTRELALVGPDKRIESILARYSDQAGNEICALINATERGIKAPVVIIPSAYGKTKESLSPLVATLLASFWAEGKNIVTLRYDGVNRPGESHQDAAHPKPGYEMLFYRPSQGLSDLKAALDFVGDNPYFTKEKVIIVSFSMSAIEVRRVLSQEKVSGVDYWISCMGVPSGQTTLRCILGGIDIISNYRLGIPNGTIGLLGHLIDMDIMAADLVKNKYVFMTDARLDMSQIDVPVLWIYGLDDKWVDVDEVKDLMSVKALGSREILEIPTGHNLRTSDDAIETFKLITSSIYEKLFEEKLVPREPSKDQMLRLLTAERERLENRAEPVLNEYWRNYLLGNERNKVGYDFYRNIPEFADFVRMQIACLGIGKKETIADLGCGTGILLEELLKYVAEQGEKVSIVEIIAVDLVQEALAKTREKCERVAENNSNLKEISFRFVQMDLEPNRLIPVAQFISSDTRTLGTLRNKIQGLSSKVLDVLIERECSDLNSVMRGVIPETEVFSKLKASLGPVAFQTVKDFGRAARFLRNSIAESDIKPDHRAGRICPENMRTSDLLFERLNFGDCKRELSLDLPENHFTKIIASLFLSYLVHPEYFLTECHRMLKPGGILLVSSMRPDCDISVMFTNYIDHVQTEDCHEQGWEGDTEGVKGARDMLNEAASLVELEEAGYFRFYTCEELKELLSGVGFKDISLLRGMGKPAQANIAIAKKRKT
jgi:ubiquinone/menaquinone biosynthesis C-methylase UbiE/pimeloyl-ACP methyl ester carboxylesterase